MLKNKILSSVSGQDKKLYPEDCFSTYLYTGNGLIQTINNGIDLAGKGGLVWIKGRNYSGGGHILVDSARGSTQTLASNLTDAQSLYTNSVSSFSSVGFDLGSNAFVNRVNINFASWTFRKAPKFFDIVTYTGNGASSRAIAHSLGQEVGMVMTKATSTTGDWNTYHRSATGDLVLNTTAAQTGSKALVNSATTSTFTVSGAANTNAVTYVAYLFAHDPSADGFIQCGSYTGSASPFSVTLGWEPQFLLVKRVDGPGGNRWAMLDSSRKWSVVDSASNADVLVADGSFDESSVSTGKSLYPTSTGFAGFTNTETNQGGTGTYIYLAIRRPNKPPTTGTQVYNAIAREGVNGAATINGVGFPPDLAFIRNRAAWPFYLGDRLRGADKLLLPYVTDSEGSYSELDSFTMDGLYFDGSNTRTNNSGNFYINHFFRRAPGFMDVVCDTGTGAAHAITHNLTKAPELIIRKSRSAATQWEVWHSALAATEKLVLNSTAAKATDSTAWNSTAPAATQFTVGTGANVNAGSAMFITYLFATLPGISKVGSYTGNGTTQTINCGFTTGARFILIKRTDSAGNWIIADSVRGILSGADPALYLNSTAAEVTGVDWVDPNIVGFDIIQEGTMNANVNGASYIFMAIA